MDDQSSYTLQTVLNLGATIGESPLWCAEERALYWMDIKKPALYRFDPKSGENRCWMVTSDIGGFALLADGIGAVVALREGLFKLEFASGALTLLAPPPFDPKFFRFNEGACDDAGRFWIGVMFDPVELAPQRQSAALHSFTLKGGLKTHSDVSDLHNGMAWSVDGKRFYLSHSCQQDIFVFPYDLESGQIGERKLFASLPKPLGIPDGAAIDVDGGYWSACHGGGRLRRYTPEGRLDRDILLPVTQPTMCAFGGENLEDLYVTSARDKLSPEQLQHEPRAGGLLRLRPGTQGVRRASIAR